MIDEIIKHKTILPRWNFHKDSKGHFQFQKTKLSKPGSFKSVLNRKNKAIGCLFVSTTFEENLGNFVVLAREKAKKSSEEILPIVKYSQKCLLCKSDLVKIATEKGKFWRKNGFIDMEINDLGVLITNENIDFCAHQNCMDFAHGNFFF